MQSECDCSVNTVEFPIRKPKGQVGCLSRGGYSLKAVLCDSGWSPSLYLDLQVP
jgi:hypothetical protein